MSMSRVLGFFEYSSMGSSRVLGFFEYSGMGSSMSKILGLILETREKLGFECMIDINFCEGIFALKFIFMTCFKIFAGKMNTQF